MVPLRLPGWLPVNAKQSREEPGVSPLCSLCHRHVEIIDHMLLCPARVEWRVQFLDRLATFLRQQGTSIPVRHLLLWGITDYFQMSSAGSAPSPTAPPFLA